MRRNYGILIGEATAERIKIEIGSAYPGQHGASETLGEGAQPVRRRAAQFHIEFSNEILRGACRNRCRASSVRSEVRPWSRHLRNWVADVAERGIVLTGGGALLRDIDKLIMKETGLPVVIADDPLTCVARGGGRILELTEEHGHGAFGMQ